MARAFRKAVAASVAAALILTAPGLPFYSALAATDPFAVNGGGVAGERAPIVLDAIGGGAPGASGPDGGGAVGNLKSRGGSRFGGRRVRIDAPGTALPPAPSREREGGTAPSLPAAFDPEHKSAASQDAPAIYGLIGSEARGANAELVPLSAREFLTPAPDVLADPSAAKSFGARFYELLGLGRDDGSGWKRGNGGNGSYLPAVTRNAQRATRNVSVFADSRRTPRAANFVAPSRPALPPAPSHKWEGVRRAVKVAIVAAAVAVLYVAAPLQGFVQGPISAPAAAGSLGGALLDAAGLAGNVVGNVLGIVFPFVKTFKLHTVRRTEHVGISGDLAAFGASMLNAVVAMSAGIALGGPLTAVALTAFWGLQNLVSGLGLLANARITRTYQVQPGVPEAAVPGYLHVGKDSAIRRTLKLAGLIIAMSVGVYALGAFTLPALLPALNSVTPALAVALRYGGTAASAILAVRALLKGEKLDAVVAAGFAWGSWAGFAGVTEFRLLANTFSAMAFTYLAYPDVKLLMKTKDTGEHSSWYHLTYLVATLGLAVWSGQMWWRSAVASETRRHAINAGLYLLSAGFPAVALWLIRKFGKEGRSDAKTLGHSDAQTPSSVASAQPLPPAVKIEAAASPGVGAKLLEYMDKMDADVKFLAFDLNWGPFADKLEALSKQGIPVEGFADRRQAFTETSLVGRAISRGVNILTVPGLLSKGADDEDGSLIGALESLVRGSGLRPEAQDKLVKALQDAVTSTLDTAEQDEANKPKPHRGIQHIKLVLGTDKQGNRYLVVGSANFTRAALGDDGVAANHDVMLFLTYPKDHPAESLAAVVEKFEKIKAQAKDTTQDPAPPVHDPQPGITPNALAPPRVAAAPAPERGLLASKGAVSDPSRFVSEDILGIHHIRGIAHDPTLKSLLRAPWKEKLDRILLRDAEAVQGLISRQYGVSQADLAALAAKHHVPADDRAAWLAVYDRLRALNRRSHDLLDSQKHEFSVRELFTKEFWRGLGTRLASDIQKYQIRALFLFPYHLFDMFVFGYFRKAWSFEFFHGHEDFLSIGQPGLPARIVEEALASPSNRTLSGLRAAAPARVFSAVLLRPFLQPLFQFTTRRATLAVFSAISMGLVGGLTIFPFMSWSLVAHFPALLHVGAWVGAHTFYAATGLGLLSAVPAAFQMARGLTHGDRRAAAGAAVGLALSTLLVLGAGALGPVFQHAIEALLKDLVVGPLLQTWVLSSLLAVPRVLEKQKGLLRRARGLSPNAALGFAASLRLTLKALYSKEVLTTFVGMVTVGAEIEGIMTYAGVLDGFVHGATGADVHVFEKIGAAVERPGRWTDEQGRVHENLIPFGGAITWGNSLLLKAQTHVLGFNLSDAVLGVSLPALNKVFHTQRGERLVAELAVARPVGDSLAARLVHEPVRRSSGQEAPGDGLSERDQRKVKARLDAAVARGERAGDVAKELKAEAARAREHIGILQDKLRKDSDALARLRRGQRPLPPGAQERHDALARELEAQRQKLAVLDKLAQRGDLLGGGKDPKALKELQALDKQLAGKLPEHTPSEGSREALQERQATLAALQKILPDLDPRKWGQAKEDGSGMGAAEQSATDEALREIKTLLDGGLRGDGSHEPGLFELQERAKLQLEARETHAKTLAAERELRNHALKAKRGGNERDELYKNLSKLSMVMEFSFQLNKIHSAQQAVRDMQKMIDERIAAIKKQKGVNSEHEDAAQANLGNIAGWSAEIDAKVKEDNSKAQDFSDIKWEADGAVTHIRDFRERVSALLTAIDSEDKGLSGSAPAEYARVLDPEFLARVKAKRQGGDPADPDATSVAKVEKDLADVEGKIKDATQGIADIEAKRFSESAGLFILLVPGTPEFHGANPTPQQILQYIDQRKAYWVGERDKYRDHLNKVVRQLDPENAAIEKDDFGLPRPESKARMLADWKGKLASAKRDAASLTAAMDQKAAEIEAIGGGHIDRLSGLGYKELGDRLKTYVDGLSTVSAPNTVKGYEAKFKMLELAVMLPQLGRRTVQWAEADKTVEALNDAVHRVLPLAKQASETLVAMMESVIADGEKDREWITTPLPSDRAAREAFQNGLIDRKRAMLQHELLPRLTAVRDFLKGTLLPFAQDGVKGLDTRAGHEDNIITLYEKKRELYGKVRDSLTRDFPWTIASGGAKLGAVEQAEVKIDDLRAFYQKHLDGWDDEVERDADGKPLHHEGIHEFQLKVSRRKDPNYTARDTLYGRDVAYSLPRRVAEMNAARDRAYPVLLARAKEIDAMMAAINARTNNKYALTPISGLAQDPNNLKDLIKPLGERLKAIADENKAVPAPPPDSNGAPTVSNEQRVAKTAFDALEKLLPSSTSPNGTSMAENIAEWLFNDGVARASQKALDPGGRIPRAEVFLTRAESVLNRSIADLETDRAFVRGYPNGSETGTALLDRKTAILLDQAAFAAEGAAYFREEGEAENDSRDTLDKIRQFYQAQSDMGGNGNELADAGIEAMQKIRDGLQEFYNELETNRRKIEEVWLPQLNDPRFSALRKVSASIAEIQKKTEEVLRRKVTFDRSQENFEWANRRLSETLRAYHDQQTKLAEALKSLPRSVTLDPKTLARVQKALAAPGSWLVASGPADPAAALVIRKADWPGFAEKLLSALKPEVDVSSALQDLIRDPSRLTQLLAGAKMMQFGDDADGFYLVTQNQFSTPGGIENSNRLILGNVATLWGWGNVSLTGYHFASPPNDVNAPWGDQGLAVNIESIEGRNFVNYLDITFHRNLQNLPEDMSTGAQLKTTRMMVFEDFAALVMGDKLYIGAAGFGDWALSASKDQPYYYGGNFKASMQFREAVKLNVEQQALWAEDPRRFVETLNIDKNLSGFDKSLDKDFTIDASGERKRAFRTQVGPSIDLQKLWATKEAFSVDVFVANQWGTDDINQKSHGATVVKGFAFPLFGRDASLTTQTGGELGQKYNTLNEKLTLMLPDTGLSLSAEGKILGPTSALYYEAGFKKDEHTDVRVGYGSRYVGQRDRLTISLQSHYTLAEIFGAAVEETRDRAKGGSVLKDLGETLDKYLEGEDREGRLPELKRVYASDAARALLTQEVGELAAQIRKLQQAGSLKHNTSVRSILGFVSGPVSEAKGDKATGGGWQVGGVTELTMTKTERALLDRQMSRVYLATVKLEERLVEVTRQWQSLAMRIHLAEADARLAATLLEKASDPVVRREAEVRLAEANARKHQAALEYNTLTGRPQTEPTPFEGLSRRQIGDLSADLERRVRLPGRLTEILSALPSGALPMTEQGMNLMDFVPLAENIHFMIGAQLQDLMATQIIGPGLGVRLPIWDASKGKDAAYVLEDQAAVAEVVGAFRRMDLKTAQQRAEAASWSEKAATLEAGQEQAAADLKTAIAAYRNGLISAAQMWEAADRWHWYTAGLIEARMKGATAAGQADVDPMERGRLHKEQSHLAKELAKLKDGDPRAANLRARKALVDNALEHLTPPGPRAGPPGERVVLDDLGRAWERAKSREHSPRVAELEKRAAAAEKMQKAVRSRIQKVTADLNWGINVTSLGTGWLPAFGVTGLWAWPVLDFQLKPAELADLEAHQEGARHEYYEKLRERAEARVAQDLYQNYLMLWTSKEQAGIYRSDVLPVLERELAQASGSDRAAAQEDRDRARNVLSDIEARARDATRLLDYLLDLPLDTPIDTEVNPEKAKEWVEGVIADRKPAALESYLYQMRIDVAMDAHKILGENLRPEDVKGEPISLVIRALGRLKDALVADPSAGQDVVDAAMGEIREARRGKESHERTTAVEQARLAQELAQVRARLRDLTGNDPVSRLRALELRQREQTLAVEHKALGEGAGSVEAGAAAGGLPTSFAELKGRLVHAEEGRAVRPDVEALPEGVPVEMLRHAAEGNHRAFRARTTMDGEPINRTFSEDWTTVMLKDPRQDDPEKVRQLTAVQRDKGDKLYQAALAKARADAEALAAQFEMYTQLYRAARKAAPAGTEGLSRSHLSKYEEKLLERLDALRQDIVARAGLEPAQATREALMALVPEDGAVDPLAVSRGFLRRVQALRTDAVAHILFDGLLPQANEEDIRISKLKADMIAQRMSYKGFTPVFAFGTFRGVGVFTGAIEAPNPEQVQSKLTDVLGDAVKRAIGSEQRKKELGLRLHSLMSSVDDGTHLVEKRQELLEAAQGAYAAAVEKRASGIGSEEEQDQEVARAQEHVIEAFKDLTGAMVQLRMDFVSLVADLEAIGLREQAGGLLGLNERVALPAAPALPDLARHSVDGPKVMFLDYVSGRMADGAFAERLEAALRFDSGEAAGADPALAPKREALLRLAGVYRQAVEDDQTVRYADIDGARRLQFLTAIDAEGRRLAVRGALLDLLETPGFLRAGDGPWLDMLGVVTRDLDQQARGATTALAERERLYSAVRAAYWHGRQGVPLDLEADFRRVESRWREKETLRQTLFQEYLANRDGALDFLVRNLALDRYLKAQQAYDHELLALFSDSRVQGDREMLRALDSLYDFRQTRQRQLDKAAFGRGPLALDALIELAQARLDALKGSAASADRVLAAAQQLDQFKDLKARWSAQPPGPLHAKLGLDDSGQRRWDAQGWLAAEDRGRLLEYQRLKDAAAAYAQIPADRRLVLPDGDRQVEFLVPSPLPLAGEGVGERAGARAEPPKTAAEARKLGYPLSPERLQELRGRLLLLPAGTPAVADPEAAVRLGARDWKGERVVTVEGREFLVPAEFPRDPRSARDAAGMRALVPGGRELRVLELLSGADIRRAAAEERGKALDLNRQQRRLGEVFAGSEFALVNGHTDGFSKEEYAALRSEGRLLFFSKEADPQTGLHRNLFPWLAASYRPGSYETRVYYAGWPAIRELDQADAALQLARTPSPARSAGEGGPPGPDEGLRKAAAALSAARDSLASEAAPGPAAAAGLDKAIQAVSKALKAPEGQERDTALDQALAEVSSQAGDVRARFAIGRDRFPYRESIPASDVALKTLEIGPAGYQALAQEAEAAALRARRSEFLSVKLTAYGFATDASGGLTGVYLTDREFDKAVSDVAEAPALLRTAERRLSGLREDLAEAQEALYGRAPKGDTPEKRAEDARRLERRPEGGRAGKAAELALQREALESQGDSKQRERAQVGRALAKAEAKAEAARRELGAVAEKIAVQEAEIRRLEELKRSGPALRFFLSDQVTWVLDADGDLVAVEARPVRGKGPLSVTLGDPSSARSAGRVVSGVEPEGARRADEGRKVSGWVAAVKLDKQTSRVLKVYTRSELERASAHLELQDVNKDPHRNGDKEIKTHFRIWKWVDPQDGNQIYLNRDFLLERLDKAEGGLSRAKHFAYLPKNWLNILLQVPKGIAQAPEEVLFGVDPMHQGYVGKALLLRGEGGGVPRHGALMSAVHFLDLLEMIPNPTPPYLDPSQFPQVVVIDGPIEPGEAVFQKDPRTRDGKWSVWFGRPALERQVQQAREDIEAYRAAPLLESKGGYQKIVMDDRRGRGQERKPGDETPVHDVYQISRVSSHTGPEGSAARAAAEAEGAALDPRTGLQADLDVTPRHVAVSHIHETLTLWPGAEGYERQMRDLREEVAAVESQLGRAAQDAEAVQGAARDADAELARAEAERLGDPARKMVGLRQRVADLEAKLRRLDRRIGEREVRSGAIADLLRRIADLKHRLALEQAYLQALQEELRKRPARSRSWWITVAELAVVGIVLAWLARLLWGKRKEGEPRSLLSRGWVPGPVALKADWVAKKVKGWFRR